MCRMTTSDIFSFDCVTGGGESGEDGREGELTMAQR